MAAVTITKQDVAANGFDLTNATFETLVSGAGNGVVFDYHPHNIIVLKNPTGGAAVFTIKVKQPSSYSTPGITIPDETVSVPTGETYLYPSLAIFKDSNAQVTVECDVAGEVIVIRHKLD